jgi:uncharacterized membrane protein YeiH
MHNSSYLYKHTLISVRNKRDASKIPAEAAEGKRSDRLVLGFDLAATFVFGLEGASSGVNANLDLLGVLVLAFVTALGGGVVRDVVIGDVPPAAFRFQRYVGVALAGGLLAFIVFRPISRAPSWVLIGGALCLVLRVLAAWQHWGLPKAGAL